jgi:hypothetical protein
MGGPNCNQFPAARLAQVIYPIGSGIGVPAKCMDAGFNAVLLDPATDHGIQNCIASNLALGDGSVAILVKTRL